MTIEMGLQSGNRLPAVFLATLLVVWWIEASNDFHVGVEAGFFWATGILTARWLWTGRPPRLLAEDGDTPEGEIAVRSDVRTQSLHMGLLSRRQEQAALNGILDDLPELILVARREEARARYEAACAALPGLLATVPSERSSQALARRHFFTHDLFEGQLPDSGPLRALVSRAALAGYCWARGEGWPEKDDFIETTVVPSLVATRAAGAASLNGYVTNLLRSSFDDLLCYEGHSLVEGQSVALPAVGVAADEDETMEAGIVQAAFFAGLALFHLERAHAYLSKS